MYGHQLIKLYNWQCIWHRLKTKYITHIVGYMWRYYQKDHAIH